MQKDVQTPATPATPAIPAIDAIQHLPPEDPRGLSNHLPMALHALQALGADAARLDAFTRHYARRFGDVSAPPAVAIPVADWQSLRGQPAAYASLRASFAVQLQTQGRDAALRQVLPALWPGLAAAAFHGLIRTGHAVQGGSDSELAQGLAYWAWRWQPVQTGEAAAADLDVQAWLAELARRGGRWQSPSRMIAGRIREVQHTPAYITLAERLQPQAGGLSPLLPPLAAFAARRYAETRNFTVLHMVTACRAVAVLAPWLDDVPETRAALLRAYAAAYLSCGVTQAALPEEAAALEWPAVVAIAQVSTDDHIVKLVHACRDLQDRLGAGPWLAAARRAIAAAQA